MMLGLCAVLGNRYRVRSNRESGLGRFDIQLMPLVNGIPGFIFEFKHTNDAHVDLGSLAEKALQQIDEKKYDTDLLCPEKIGKVITATILKISLQMTKML